MARPEPFRPTGRVGGHDPPYRVAWLSAVALLWLWGATRTHMRRGRWRRFRMKRWTPLAGVLTAGVLVFGSAAPASAAQTPNLHCQTVLSAKLYELTTYANYDDDVVAPGIRRWNYFRFMVHGG